MITFTGSNKSETEEHTLVCYDNTKNEIYLEIRHEGYESCYIVLDIETAIAFRKQLTKSIGYAKGGENG